MDRFIKSSTTIFGGYLYQNLVGLEVICNWLDDPGQYEWVKFEADDDEIPKGLDDIVAQRTDGAFVLLQAKFTVDPFDEDNFLNWEWLLKHKPMGKSLLQKWANALFAVGIKNTAEVALLTNRLPDRNFYACLNAVTNHVDLALVPDETRAQIVEQLGSQEVAAQFFQSFEFRHSHQGYLSLRRTLLDRYVPRHTTYHGWNALFTEAIDWAVRKNFPSSDGCITLNLLRGVLACQRPEPLDQLFRIPDGYCPPDEIFSNDFIKSVSAENRKIVVLWGSPGQGKSTFLSYVCTKLEKLETPYIRHHYFLNLTDTSDRFSFPAVANSLMAQMEAHHIEHVQGKRNGPEYIREWIEACANGYAAAGKRFVLIVDGLDHVWRENELNRQFLESLFRYLFPVPNNVTLLIGTQKVSEEQLPSQFPKFVDANDWVELPRMSLTAIRGWLECLLKANRFELQKQAFPIEQDTLTVLAEAFHRLSGGHPLHLTYSFEALAREQHVLTPELVNELPDCPEGDIKKYYRTLWQRLPFQAKDALHLVADAGFIWPPLGLEDCLDVRVGELKREIGHLFYFTDAGQIPFHGSVLAFIREDSEHKGRIKHLLPSVTTWLETKAPAYHRWGWLWLYRARMGRTDELLNCPSRAWAIDSLAKAYPEEQIIQILSVAERLAFESRQFARAVRLRWLKIRLENGPEFQLDDYSRVYACALALSDDDYPLRNLSASFLTASIKELHLLGKQYLALGRISDTAECQEQIRRRINDRLKAHAYDDRSLEEMSKQFLELAAATKDYEPDKLLKSIRGFGRLSSGLFRFFIRALSKHHDLSLLLAFLPHPIPKGMRGDLELAIVRLAGVCQARLHDWPEFKKLRKHPIIECWARLYARDKILNIRFATSAPELDAKVPLELPEGAIEHYLHALFFHVLAKCLELNGTNPLILIVFKERPWLDTAVGHIIRLATTVGKLIARRENPDFGFIYRLTREVVAPEGYDAFSDYASFRRALLSISTDLFLLTSLRTGISEIPLSEWRLSTESRHFLFSEWLKRYIESGYTIVSNEAVRMEIQNRLAEEAGQVSLFNERTQNYLELCELAVFQQLDALAKVLLVKTIDCVLGYGFHKDTSIICALDAIAAVAMVDPDFARSMLSRVCPAVAGIDKITDGDETRHAQFVMAEQFSQLMPRSYVAYYEYLLKTSEWYVAEEVFSRRLQKEPLDFPLMQLATKGVWNSRSIDALRHRAEKGDRIAERIIDRNARFFGHLSEDFGKDRFQYSSPTNEEHGIDVKAFEPAALTALLTDLNSRHIYVGEGKAVREWFDYWKTARRGAELLRALEPFLEEEKVPGGVVEVLDDAFELSLTLEGKQKAYRWIVVAQIHGHGWNTHNYEDAALKRFNTFAEHYASRWEEFILDTSRPAFHTAAEKLVIPSNRLVQFMVAVGQVQTAREVTEQLVSVVVEEMADQPLESPPWFLGY